jgi:hypothetical protein
MVEHLKKLDCLSSESFFKLIKYFTIKPAGLCWLCVGEGGGAPALLSFGMIAIDKYSSLFDLFVGDGGKLVL